MNSHVCVEGATPTGNFTDDSLCFKDGYTMTGVISILRDSTSKLYRLIEEMTAKP